MKVVAINGSPKEQGNTFAAIRAVCEQLEASLISLPESEKKTMFNFIR